MSKQKLDIVHISAECYPIAKVGGLADVVGSLPKYLNRKGQNTSVIMPFYDTKYIKENASKSIYKSDIDFWDKELKYSIRQLYSKELGFNVYFVDIPGLLDKENVYTSDDIERFIAFQIAALDWILSINKKPDIVHCHDHHTGLIPFMIQECHRYKPLNQIPTILTIHNAQYQGMFDYDKLNLLPDFDHKNIGLLDWDGSINSLAAGIKCAWRVTTVSPNYMEELKENAYGLEGLLRHESKKCVGILNGIDTEVWNPQTDPYIIKNFKTSTVISGKKANKKWLCKKFELDNRRPLVGFIGRLVEQKGVRLFPEVLNLILDNIDVSILLLGSGDSDIEQKLYDIKPKHKGKFNVYIGYDERLSHIIYAGADFLLMPSLAEPCGLNQMYSMRYGTVPIVSAVGGLKDTVIDITQGGFGIVHNRTTVKEVYNAVKRATSFYLDKTAYRKNQKYIMTIDHSWEVSASEYIQLYKSLIE